MPQYLLRAENGHASIKDHRSTCASKLVRGDVKFTLTAHHPQSGLTVAATIKQPQGGKPAIDGEGRKFL